MSKEKDNREQVEFNGYQPAEFHIVCGQGTDYDRRYRIGIWGVVNGNYYAINSAKLDNIGEVEGRGTFLPDAMALEKHQAEELMDSLWEAGIRPDKAKLKKLQVGALEDHLSDMKKMVFEYLMPALLDQNNKSGGEIDQQQLNTMFFEGLKKAVDAIKNDKDN